LLQRLLQQCMTVVSGVLHQSLQWWLQYSFYIHRAWWHHLLVSYAEVVCRCYCVRWLSIGLGPVAEEECYIGWGRQVQLWQHERQMQLLSQLTGYTVHWLCVRLYWTCILVTSRTLLNMYVKGQDYIHGLCVCFLRAWYYLNQSAEFRKCHSLDGVMLLLPAEATAATRCPYLALSKAWQSR